MPLVINGQVVDDAVLAAEFSEIKAYHERLGNISCCERDPEFRGYARDNIIARAVLAQEARRRLDPVTSAEVDAALLRLQEAHGGEAAFYAAIGATPEQLRLVRDDVETELRVARMIDTLADAEGAADEQAAQDYYATHLPDFMTDERVRASHILKSPAHGEDRKAAYQALRTLRTDLLGGADYDEAARAHSDKASEHIDLGFFKRGELPEEFESVAFSMTIGEISPVFVSPYGYHILKVTEREAPQAKPFETVRDEVLQRMRLERRNEVTRKLAAELRASSTIEDLNEEQDALATASATSDDAPAVAAEVGAV